MGKKQWLRLKQMSAWLEIGSELMMILSPVLLCPEQEKVRRRVWDQIFDCTHSLYREIGCARGIVSHVIS